MQYLTAEEVIVIHSLAIRTFGGRPGLLDEGRLQSCVEAPKQTMFGNELYPDLKSKAAILFFTLVKNHPFVDANKRTGVLALLEFLQRNGYDLDATDDDLYAFAMQVATSVLEKEGISTWVQAHIKVRG
jgi:death-on-curing protein